MFRYFNYVTYLTTPRLRNNVQIHDYTEWDSTFLIFLPNPIGWLKQYPIFCNFCSKCFYPKITVGVSHNSFVTLLSRNICILKQLCVCLMHLWVYIYNRLTGGVPDLYLRQRNEPVRSYRWHKILLIVLSNYRNNNNLNFSCIQKDVQIKIVG